MCVSVWVCARGPESSRGAVSNHSVARAVCCTHCLFGQLAEQVRLRAAAAAAVLQKRAVFPSRCRCAAADAVRCQRVQRHSWWGWHACGMCCSSVVQDGTNVLIDAACLRLCSRAPTIVVGIAGQGGWLTVGGAVCLQCVGHAAFLGSWCERGFNWVG